MAKKKKSIVKRKFLQFNDWIARMYPELHSFIDYDHGKLGIISRSFTFQVTDKCNLACTYCYQINKGTRKMKLEDAKKAVDNLLTGANGFDAYLNPKKSPGIVIEFIGGEPFLEIELIDQIVDYFREQAILLRHPWAEKYCISICSNGVLYRDERVQRFIMKNLNALSFSVTVDGVQELHDSCRVFPDGSPSYYLAHDAAMDWMNMGHYIGSKITIAPENITYVADSLEQMINDGYYDINANFVYEEGWKPEHAREIYEQIKKFTDKTVDVYDMNSITISLLNSNGRPMTFHENRNWCGGTGDMLSMDPDGKLFPCIRYMESSLGSSRKPYSIGDIHTGLAVKPEHKQCVKCLNEVTRRSESDDSCWYCTVAEGCGWCSGYNYQTFGTVDKRTTFHCDMHKARSLCTAYYINKHILSGDDGEPQPIYLPKSKAIELIGEDNYNELVQITKKVKGFINETDKELVKVKGKIIKNDMKYLTFFNADETDVLNDIKEKEKVEVEQYLYSLENPEESKDTRRVKKIVDDARDSIDKLF